MRKPTFLEGVAVALAASFAGSILYTAMAPVVSTGEAARLLIAAGGLAYVLYLLSRTSARVGRMTTVTVWMAMALLTWLAGTPIALYVVIHLGAVWVVRSIYFYSSALSALADLALSAFSLAAAVWALIHSSSLFLGIWCLFLVQALFVCIPPRLGRKTDGGHSDSEAEDRFQRAHRAAESALRRLSSAR